MFSTILGFITLGFLFWLLWSINKRLGDIYKVLVDGYKDLDAEIKGEKKQ